MNTTYRHAALLWPVVLLIAFFGCSPTNSPSPPNSQNAKPNGDSLTGSASRSASKDSVVKFVDTTSAAGIDFRHQNSKTDRKYLLETMGSGAAFLDYDGDGYLDVLLLNNRRIPGGEVQGTPSLKLYRNNHNGTFTDATHQAGLDKQPLYAMGVAVSDYDNDGRDDIYVTCALDTSRLFHNEGGGKFKDVTKEAGVSNAGNWGTSCAWLDYDKDGKLDLFVCNYVKYRSLADDQPCFSGEHMRTYCIPSAYEASHCTLYHNEGHGKFKDVSVSSGIAAAEGKSLGVSVWDFDGDGLPDIFVANDTVPGFLFHNLGNGTFKDIGVESAVAYNEEGIPHSGMGIDTGDPSNSGKTSLLITNYYGQQTSFYNQMTKDVFRDDRLDTNIGPQTAKYLGFGVFFFDFDNDGLKDIFQVNGHVQDDIQTREPETSYPEATLLLRNTGNGKYQEVGLKSGPPFDKKVVGRGAAWGDYDNDGLLDVIVTVNNGMPMLWHNESRVKNHWLGIKLVGRKSNRNGIGAEIRVSTGSFTQRDYIRSGSSYLCASDLRAHFGLGSSIKADVEIRWPSGVVDTIPNTTADQIITAREGEHARL